MARGPFPRSTDGQYSIARPLAVLMLVLALAAGAGSGQPRPVAAQIPGGTNLTLTPSTSSPQAGEAVTFSYRASPPAVAPPFASITSLTLDFGDGATADLTGSFSAGQTVTGTTTHTYASPGSYTAVLTASASNGGSGRSTAELTVTGTGPVPGQGVSVTYQPGWNLISMPAWGTIPGPLGPVYTFQAGDTAYQQVQNPQNGLGYWVYFPSLTTATIPSGSPQTITKQLPPGQYIMVGNPGSQSATVRGADVVYVYDSATGYQQTATLRPGQGAWVVSNLGGTVMVSNGS